MKVTIESLTKAYPKGVTALDGVNLDIGEGMFGLLGPNGAGKTTLMSILATLARPTSGVARVDGWDVSDPRQRWLVKGVLGYLPQELGLYPDLTAREFLAYMATLKGFHERRQRRVEVDRLLAAVGLESQAGRRTKTLSGGMRRRLGIAQALIGDPRLLIVDEPTAGLDPEERVRFRTLLAGLASGRIVILSTHIVEDVAATCRDLAVLVKGRVEFRGSPAQLTEHARGNVWEVSLPPDTAPEPAWRVVASIADADGTRLRILGPRPANANLSVSEAAPRLEDGYLSLLSGRIQVK
ncbi:MAG: ABC transporter ATP-binding protein [Trueperaceae bacterium]|nr:ABC transporter ATP-binding protein [Trueperaceae bacterium]